MDPLHFCIGIAPLCVYLLLIGILNLRNTPFVTTGARDTAGLAIAVSGMVIAGPMELFYPDGAASQFQYAGVVWIMLIVFYGLCVSLAVLLMRSRIVIYNVSLEQLRPILNAVAMKMDNKSRWVGDSLHMPQVHIHLHVESAHWLKNIQLTAGGSQQSYESWTMLEKELRVAVKQSSVSPNYMGIGLLIVSGILSLGTAIWMVAQQDAVRLALEEMLRR